MRKKRRGPSRALAVFLSLVLAVTTAGNGVILAEEIPEAETEEAAETAEAETDAQEAQTQEEQETAVSVESVTVDTETVDASGDAAYPELTTDEEFTAEISTAGDYVYFTFTPEEDGTYLFYSTGGEDTYAYLYDADMNQLTSDDDSGEDNNALIKYELEAETVYYIAFRYYDSSTTGSFSVYAERYYAAVSAALTLTNSITYIEGLDSYEEEDDDGETYECYLLSPDAFSSGDLITVTYEDGSTTVFTFDSDGYGFYDTDGNELSYSFNSDQTESHWETGGSYSFTLTLYDLDDVTVEVPVSVIENPYLAAATDLTAGSTASAVISEAGAYVYYRFTPEETGYYEFEASNDDYSVRIYLFDDEQNQLSYASSYYPSVTELLEADTVYYFAVRFSASDVTGSIAVELSEIPLTGSCGDDVSYSFEISTGVLTISGTGDMKDFDYMSEVPWYGFRDAITQVVIESGVTSIGDYAFCDCSALEGVTIASTVTSIGYDSFYDCSALTDVTLPEGLTQIGRYAFAWCDNLTGIEIPDTVTSIGSYAFYYCQSMTGVTLPSSLGTISSGMFYYCSALTEVTIPEGVTSIAYSTFYGCTSLAEVTIPDSVTSIGSYAFYRCTSLTEVTIPDSVTSIGDYAFYYCTSLTKADVPDSCTIGTAAFAGCSLLADDDGFVIISGVLCGYDGDASEVTIPDDVTVIGAYAFSDCSEIESIVIPDGVTAIEEYAFEDCTGLVQIEIPDSVTSIGYGAFYECTSLTSIVIPDGVTSIESYTFYRCSALTDVTIPDSVTQIEYYAFYGCSSLQTIALPDGLEEISSSVFRACSALTEITIPDGVTEIGYAAFYGCSALSEITIPDSVTYIGSYAFYGCSSLASVVVPEGCQVGSNVFTGCTLLADDDGFVILSGILYGYNGSETEITIPDSVTEIGWYAFYENDTIVSVVIPDSVTEIGYSAFEYCENLQNVTIGNGVTSIGKYAFYECSSLSSITIPDSVTSIGYYAFHGCESLTEITIPDSVIYIGENAFSYCTGLTAVTLSSGMVSIEDGLFYRCTALEDVTIPDSIAYIGEYAFGRCTALEEITIPDSVAYIGYYAFYGCTALTSVSVPADCSVDSMAFYGCTGLSDEDGFIIVNNILVQYIGEDSEVVIPDSVTQIAADAFEYNTVLRTVTIPDGVTYIGNYAFSGCTSLEEVVIPDSVTDVGYAVFAYCTSLKSVTLSASLTEIGSSMFEDCSSLTSVEIPDSVTSIGSYAFYNCSALTSVTIPDSVTYIGYYAFYNCTALASVSIPEDTSMGEGAFSGCSLLTDEDGFLIVGTYLFEYSGSASTLTIPSGVTVISAYVFEGNETLTSVVIPDSVTQIGYDAFYGCSNLKSVTLPDGLLSIEYDAFAYCTALTSIEIPDSLTYMGSYAFYGCSSLTDITLPSRCPVGSYAFSGCGVPLTSDGLLIICNMLVGYEGDAQSLTIPDTVTEIAANAIPWDYDLTDITIPASVEYIGEGAFYRCYALENITVASGNTAYSSEDGVLFNADQTQLIAYPQEKADETYTIPDTVTEVASYAFYNVDALTSLTVPGRITDISAYAFYGMGSLTSLTLEEGIETIGNYAFADCGEDGDGISELIIPEGVTTIGTGAFEYMNNPETISLPDSLTSIGDYAFYQSTYSDYTPALTELTIPANVQYLGYEAFYGNTSLESITFLGDAPTVTDSGYTFYGAKATVYYYSGADGWTDEYKNNLRLHTALTFVELQSTGNSSSGSGTTGSDGIYRVSGSNRYETMDAIAQEVFGDTGSTYAVIATGTNFPDALAAASLAGVLNAPIILVSDAKVDVALDTLDSLGVTYAYVIGGESAVSETVVSKVEAAGITTERIYGANRFATAIAIADKVNELQGTVSDTCIVASGANFPDALSGSPYSYWAGAPIYLAKADGSINEDTLNAIREAGYTKIIVLGGEAVVSASAYSSLQSISGVSVERLYGANRYYTAQAVAEWSVAQGMTYDNLAVATGTSFPDALAGAALCGTYGSVLLLAKTSVDDSSVLTSVLEDEADEISTVYVFGGESAVSADILTAIESILSD